MSQAIRAHVPVFGEHPRRHRSRTSPRTSPAAGSNPSPPPFPFLPWEGGRPARRLHRRARLLGRDDSRRRRSLDRRRPRARAPSQRRRTGAAAVLPRTLRNARRAGNSRIGRSDVSTAQTTCRRHRRDGSDDGRRAGLRVALLASHVHRLGRLLPALRDPDADRRGRDLGRQRRGSWRRSASRRKAPS